MLRSGPTHVPSQEGAAASGRPFQSFPIRPSDGNGAEAIIYHDAQISTHYLLSVTKSDYIPAPVARGAGKGKQGTLPHGQFALSSIMNTLPLCFCLRGGRAGVNRNKGSISHKVEVASKFDDALILHRGFPS